MTFAFHLSATENRLSPLQPLRCCAQVQCQQLSGQPGQCSQSVCVACAAGQYSATGGQAGRCGQCGAGTFSNVSGERRTARSMAFPADDSPGRRSVPHDFRDRAQLGRLGLAPFPILSTPDSAGPCAPLATPPALTRDASA